MYQNQFHFVSKTFGNYLLCPKLEGGRRLKVGGKNLPKPNFKTKRYTWRNVQVTTRKAPLGFEPRISCLLDRRFNQLSHGAKDTQKFSEGVYTNLPPGSWSQFISLNLILINHCLTSNIHSRAAPDIERSKLKTSTLAKSRWLEGVCGADWINQSP